MAQHDIFLQEEREAAKRALSNRQILRFLWTQWMQRKALFAGLFGFGLLATAFDLALPVMAGRLVDSLTDPSRAEPWGAYAFFVGVSVAFHTLRQMTVRCEVPMTVANMSDLVNGSFARVQRFSAQWHADSFAGSLVRKLTRGMWAYDTITATLFLGLMPTVIVLFGMSLYLLVAFPLIGLYAISIVGLFCVLNLWLLNSYIRPRNIISNARDSEIGAVLADSLGANAVVKSFGAEAREEAILDDAVSRWARATFRTWMAFVNSWLVQIGATLLLQAGLVGLLLVQWKSGNASPGDVVLAITAFMLMAGYLRRFGEETQNIRKGLDEIEDLAIFARQEPDIADKRGAQDITVAGGDIRFEHVHFRYGEAREPLYEDFSLHIKAGERIALVGPTGSGKSTFVRLLQRLYEIEGGAILVDGHNIAEVTQASLRRAVALVPQEPVLFHRTIAQNIAYGRPAASLDEVIRAAETARAHDFISQLPRGYETLVGERGIKLSGGERQRVAIARALLANAPILVLDEATSSLDNQTERDVQLAMDALMQARTTIVVAHRLSTIRSADRILVFDQGRIVEQGTHAALKAKGGLYATLEGIS
jgi:ATP-binding cassette, subfamily B, bacterial